MITKAPRKQNRNVLLNAYRDAVRDTAVKTMAKRGVSRDMRPIARKKFVGGEAKPNWDSRVKQKKATARLIGR